MEKTNKIGVLKYIASTGARGVKFEDQPETWYNPANDEAKEMVKDEFKGKQVEIMLVEGKKTEFTSMVLLEAKPKDPEEVKPKVETIKAEDYNKKKEEEKVPPQTPPPKEEAPIEQSGPETTEDEIVDLTNEIKSAYEILRDQIKSQDYTQETYFEMEQTKLETAKKGPHNLTYASWAEAWGALKRLNPTATYHVHEDAKTGMPYINDPAVGAFVKVSVTVKGLKHTVHLPVMNHSNKAAKGAELDVFLINKNIQRAFTKAIAMHGLGLYVFKGEDYPEETNEVKKQ
jgi:hypothetical protein